MSSLSIFEHCPVYASDHFELRLVEETDAPDLLHCYSNPSAVRLMNSDNCSSDFYYQTLDRMQDCIRGWLSGYRARNIVRLTIVDGANSEAVGTVELYAKTKTTGILRLDVAAAYENQGYLLELIRLSTDSFYSAFDVKHVLMKAIPAAGERISALVSCGFASADDHDMKPHGDYYIHSR